MNFFDLTLEEQNILRVFIKLICDMGLINNFTFLKKTYKESSFCIYKENDKWISYIYEHGERHEYHENNSLYGLCLDIFSSLGVYDEEYCLNAFPTLVQDINNEFGSRTR